jgi:DNA-binding GntR family transcriptional regulator
VTTGSLDQGLPETLVSYASRRIKSSLTSGQIKAGERLSPSKLAQDYGLSHIPVREALSSLAATGYVVHDRGRGYFARELTSDDLEDIYSLRKLLETEAYRRGVPNLTDQDLKTMTDLVAQMSRKLGEEDRDEYIALNRQFHFVPFRRSNSRRLVRFLDVLWDSAEPYGHLGDIDSTQGNTEHEAMLEILATRDADAVIRMMEQHRHLRMERVEGWEKLQKGDDPAS